MRSRVRSYCASLEATPGAMEPPAGPLPPELPPVAGPPLPAPEPPDTAAAAPLPAAAFEPMAVGPVAAPRAAPVVLARVGCGVDLRPTAACTPLSDAPPAMACTTCLVAAAYSPSGVTTSFLALTISCTRLLSCSIGMSTLVLTCSMLCSFCRLTEL